jgi:hypothetical protein
MGRAVFGICFLTAVVLVAGGAGADDRTAYVVDGEVKGFFCRYFGFVCGFKRVDALTGAGSNETTCAPEVPRSL